MQLSIDKFGRIVIPKTIRADLHLTAGSALTVEEREDCIILRPAQEEPVVSRKQGVLVYAGAATGQLEESVAQDRDKWLLHLAGQHR